MKTMNLQQLAERVGTTPRTIRYYIARGLVPGPVGAGPRAYYTEEHVRRIEEVRRLQDEGLTLGEIQRRLEGKAAGELLPQPSRWCQFCVGKDVIVWVREGTPPWRMHRVRELIAELDAVFGQQENNGKAQVKN
ncbi:MAG: hypothetical protein KatS3mg110_4127 [Pirellulaceae bacterium]|nr:MAG: hypothetical protein KatS3mg110_4127 [Pirellulaceae bacterium]